MKTEIQNMFIIVVLLSLATVNQTLAQTWMGTADNSWQNTENWHNNTLPSSSALFNNAGNNNTTISLGAESQVTKVIFDSADCAAYTIGASGNERLLLNSYGEITINEDVTQHQTIQSYIRLGNTESNHRIYFKNFSPVAELRISGDMGYVETTTANVQLQLTGIGDIILSGNSVTNGIMTYARVLNFSTGTFIIDGNHHFNMYGSNMQQSSGDSKLLITEGAELFFDYLNGNYSIWHEHTGLIEGTGTLRFSCGSNGEPARFYIKNGSELTIKAPIVCPGGIEMYNSTGGGMLILDCINTMTGNMLITSTGGRVNVTKIGNQGATDSNLGQGTTIELYGSNCGLIYTGEGETTDRIIDFKDNVSIEHSGSGDLIFSEDLIFSTTVARTLTLKGSTTGVGELVGAIGSASNSSKLAKDGSGEWRLSGTSSYIGNTTINEGVLTLCGTNGSIAATESITISGGTLHLANSADANSTDRVNDNAAISLLGGAIDFAHDSTAETDYSETLGAVTIADSAVSEIKVATAAESSSSTLTLTSLEIVGTGKLNFVGQDLGEEGSTRCRILFNTPPVLVNDLIPGATVNGSASAKYDSIRGVYPANNVNIAARGPDSVIPDDDTAIVQITTDGLEGPITLGGESGASVITLTQSSATPAVVEMSGKTLQAGAVIIQEDAAALTLGQSIGDGFLQITSGYESMGLINYSTNTLTVNAELYESIPEIGLSKSGAGPVQLNNKINIMGDLLVSDGVLTLGALTNGSHYIGRYFEMRGGAEEPVELKIEGPAEVVNHGNFYAGNNTGDRCVVTINNDLTIMADEEKNNGMMNIGYGSQAACSVIQNSGVLSISPGNGGGSVYNIGGSDGHGYHRQNGGTLTTHQISLGSTTGSTVGNNGVMDIFGGEVLVDGFCLVMAWAKGASALNIFDGSFSSIRPGVIAGTTIYLTYRDNIDNTAQINLLGANARMFDQVPTSSKNIVMARGANNTATVINLNNGEITLRSVSAYTTTTPSHFNFNGGLLKVATDSTTLMSGLSAANVYAGGARIDTDGFDTVIDQPLIAPQGYGVSSVELLSGGSGYIGAPIVLLNDGSGQCATAIALVDLETESPTCGQITNIMVTGAGTGYAETDTLSVVLRGGGCLTPATVGSVSLTPNVSGGLIKQGSGTLTLNGACTYTGGTLVNEGTLKLGCADALLPGSTVTLAENAILDLNGFTVTNEVVGSGTVENGTLYGEFSPAGANIIGSQTLNLGDNIALAGTYTLDVDENGACDQLAISGNVDLSALQLQVVDTEKLNRRKKYPIATITGNSQGLFAHGNLPNEKWIIKSYDSKLWLLYSNGLQLIIR